ncbi:thioesterase family protein [Xylaria digitata]|nr:thioesterase family protein [Xylaria digitata]
MPLTDVHVGFVSFSEATRIDKLDLHTYKVDLNHAFSIGVMPTSPRVTDQPNLLTSHFEFPAQTTVGPAITVVGDVKPSRRLSTLHMTLWQGRLLSHAPWITPSVSRCVVLAYATFTNLWTMAGELPRGSESWRSLTNWKFYMPRAGPSTTGILDTWIRMASGENITSGALAYVADSFPYNLHAFLTASAEQTRRDGQRVALWFPTLTMNLDMKMALPKKGVEWLDERITSKQIKNGMFDLDIMIRSVDGELVALSHHVAMIVGIERNTGTGKSSTPKPTL